VDRQQQQHTENEQREFHLNTGHFKPPPARGNANSYPGQARKICAASGKLSSYCAAGFSGSLGFNRFFTMARSLQVFDEPLTDGKTCCPLGMKKQTTTYPQEENVR
jgi:hypothetical protein